MSRPCVTLSRFHELRTYFLHGLRQVSCKTFALHRFRKLGGNQGRAKHLDIGIRNSTSAYFYWFSCDFGRAGARSKCTQSERVHGEQSCSTSLRREKNHAISNCLNHCYNLSTASFSVSPVFYGQPILYAVQGKKVRREYPGHAAEYLGNDVLFPTYAEPN